MEWLQGIAAIMSGIAAVLAWAAKLRWSKEYAAAKDETIKAKEAVIQAKEAQIQVAEREVASLRELTPMKIQEYFDAATKLLNDYNEMLKRQLEQSQADIVKKDGEIAELSVAGTRSQSDIDRLSAEKTELEQTVASLEAQETKLKPIRDDFILASGASGKIADLYPFLLGKAFDAAYKDAVFQSFKFQKDTFEKLTDHLTKVDKVYGRSLAYRDAKKSKEEKSAGKTTP
jgi:ABC-type phosphate transport system auxiliary subunit